MKQKMNVKINGWSIHEKIVELDPTEVLKKFSSLAVNFC
jgi:hypothetical protein